MKININIENLAMEVDTKGGFVNYLREGKDNIIFPKKGIVDSYGNTKVRGGIFSCIPNFGADEIKGQEPHGYGRKVEWNIAKKGENFVKLYTSGEGEYKELDTFLEYSLERSSLKIELEFYNNSSGDLLIAPGLHPYFESEENFFEVFGKDYSNENLEDSIFLEAKNLEFETKNFKIKYVSENFQTYILWTDFKDNYFCVEPTFNGTSFIKGYKNKPYRLKTKAKKEIEVILNFERK